MSVWTFETAEHADEYVHTDGHWIPVTVLFALFARWSIGPLIALLFSEANRGRISLLRCEDGRAAAELLSLPLLAPRVHPGEGHRRRGEGQTGGGLNKSFLMEFCPCSEQSRGLP